MDERPCFGIHFVIVILLPMRELLAKIGLKTEMLIEIYCLIAPGLGHKVQRECMSMFMIDVH